MTTRDILKRINRGQLSSRQIQAAQEVDKLTTPFQYQPRHYWWEGWPAVVVVLGVLALPGLAGVWALGVVLGWWPLEWPWR